MVRSLLRSTSILSLIFSIPVLTALLSTAWAGPVWRPLGPDGSGNSLALVIDPLQPANIYVGAGNGVFKSIDGGASWKPASRGLGTRVEVRCPDPTCNPYLAFAMMLNAGLDGIRNELTAPSSTDVNIYHMTAAQMKRAKIASMPASLQEATNELKKSKLAKETLGSHIFEKYVETKEKEWDSYRISVTDWELDNYLKVY